MIWYSKATDLFYREHKGQLQRFATSGDKAFKWIDSEFNDKENVRRHWKEATKEQIDNYRLKDR